MTRALEEMFACESEPYPFAVETLSDDDEVRAHWDSPCDSLEDAVSWQQQVEYLYGVPCRVVELK